MKTRVSLKYFVNDCSLNDFPWFGKTKKFSQSNIQKFQNLVVNWKKLPKSDTQKFQF